MQIIIKNVYYIKKSETRNFINTYICKNNAIMHYNKRKTPYFK